MENNTTLVPRGVAAALLGVSEAKAGTLAYSGRLPTHRLASGKPMHRINEILRLKDQLDLEAECVTSGEAAKLLGVCSQTLQNMCRRGELPFLRFGRPLLFRLDDLDAYSKRIKEADQPKQSAKAVANRIKKELGIRAWVGDDGNVSVFVGGKVLTLTPEVSKNTSLAVSFLKNVQEVNLVLSGKEVSK